MPRAAIHIIATLIILIIGYFAYQKMSDAEFIKQIGLNNEDVEEKIDKRKLKNRPRPMIRTKVTKLEKTSYTITLTAQGVVRAHHTTSLTAQVSGQVLSLSTNFEDGGFFKQGEILLEIDPADYHTELISSQAQLARAETAYAQEQARAKQALLNWQDAGFTEKPSDLVLRKPQLREAKANVTSARASLERAERNLARTKVRAPYDGRVLKRNIGPGQQIGGSTALGEIYSTDLAEIRLPLTLRDLSQYTPPHASSLDKPRPVIFTARHGNVQSTTWRGEITRTEGVLDEQSRQLIVIARIKDPFSLESNNSKRPPLFIGQPVTAKIPATTLENVYRIPREHLSGLNEILVVRGNKLKRLKITPVWSDQQDIILSADSISGDDLLATSDLPYAPDNAPVVIIDPEKEQAGKPVH